ncbi:phasyl DNA replicon protein arp [Neisseria sp. ZJ106]|uniref:Phasyl DNA replicon protein arp n=1 Tax=Neisseria lisongii TaxID=2912188 RepID=A0ABY7RML7_9NEIS|nr:phasyl DNA replicon protein arp [Neisseria lisongii]MCF7521957.1 phasyl DNA replicon protein arp [Neisseria lisongii]WCL72429.1 phasyl DNA replicon protein arp [Neisseria lisongii]WCL72483.1 phasyl DNA replicon protein arp [Neisseria lisongii]
MQPLPLRAECAQRIQLPCLNSNNCIEGSNNSSNTAKTLPIGYEKFLPNEMKADFNQFSTSHRKSSAALEMNVRQFIEAFGINHVGFLTLTFADDVQDVKEASRRFHSLRTNFLSKHFKHYVCVYERMKSGRIHFHLIVNTRENIRRGLNFRQIQARNYTSANKALRQLWALLRENMGKYGFGRSELLPVKTNSKGLAKYVSKYIKKHINSRLPEDKGYRLIRTTIDKQSLWKIANSNFSFVSAGSRLWREQLQKWIICIEPYLKQYARQEFARELKPITEENYSQILSSLISPKWAFYNRETILNM